MRLRLVASLLLSGVCLAQSIDSRLDQVVQSYVAKNEFMGSVLVARGNQVLLSKGYGSANLELQTANTPSTKFRLGSLTKQFTAAAILKLEERGKLRLEDPVNKYLIDAPSAWKKVTIFHVLTHTAGIPNSTGFSEYESSAPPPTTAEKLVAAFRDQPLEFEPGERWSYRHSGYVLLGYLIEQISGQSYEKFLQENIFKPLAMKDSGYNLNSAMADGRATGYATGLNGPLKAGFAPPNIPFAAGGLYSTTEDLLRWEQGLFGGKVLSAASLQKLTTPFKSEYAFGLQVHTVNGHKVIDHAGDIKGFNTILAYYPDERVTVAILGNLDGPAPQQIAGQLAEMIFGEKPVAPAEPKEITLDPKILGRYVGAYVLDRGPVLMITLEGNQLFSKLANDRTLPIFAESESKFFPKFAGKVLSARITFTKFESQGRASELSLPINGKDRIATRMDDADAKQLAEVGVDAAAKRYKLQMTVLGSHDALSKMIEDIRAGKPDYGTMTPGLAAATQHKLNELQSTVVRLGAIQSVKFAGVGPTGPDIYQVKFENGLLEYRIWVTPDGKILNVSFKE